MDFSLLLIKASNKVGNKRMLDQDDIEEEMMPAMVLMKNEKGEARLELRNSIILRQPSKKISPHVSKSPT